MATLLLCFLAYKLHDTHGKIYKNYRYDKIEEENI